MKSEKKVSFIANNEMGDMIRVWCLVKERVPSLISFGSMTPVELKELYEKNKDLLNEDKGV